MSSLADRILALRGWAALAIVFPLPALEAVYGMLAAVTLAGPALRGTDAEQVRLLDHVMETDHPAVLHLH
jgi:hypothetical protein